MLAQQWTTRSGPAPAAATLAAATAGVLMVMGATGCPAPEAADGAAAPESPGGELGGCAADGDCELAGASCCDCPSFAAPVADGFGALCEGAMCPPPSDRCPALHAVCDRGACAARCLPIACALQCDLGFAADPFGCLVCACATEPATPECVADDDCAQVAADCCGCARGGRDTAVPADRVQDHIDALACPASVSCPDVTTCNADEVPLCIGGRCGLGVPAPPDGEIDGGAAPGPAVCGTPDLPACPPGQVCVLNAPDAGGVGGPTQNRVGTCALQ